MSRSVFDATRAVGARANDNEAQQRPRYRCAAFDCPMTGSIFLGSGDGVCAWHYGSESHDWPRITRVLDDWRCVTQQINAVRRVLVEQPSNGKAHDAILRAARDELPQVAPQWGLEPAEHEDIGAWARRLAGFLDTCVAGKPDAEKAHAPRRRVLKHRDPCDEYDPAT